MKKKYIKTPYETIADTGRSIIRARCCYPVKNPPHAVEDITACLAYLGVFDGILRSSIRKENLVSQYYENKITSDL